MSPETKTKVLAELDELIKITNSGKSNIEVNNRLTAITKLIKEDGN